MGPPLGLGPGARTARPQAKWAGPGGSWPRHPLGIWGGCPVWARSTTRLVTGLSNVPRNSRSVGDPVAALASVQVRARSRPGPPWTGSSGRWPADPGRRSRAAYGPAVFLAVAPHLRLPLSQPSPRGHADGRDSGCLVGSRASFADGSLVAVASCGSYSAARDPPAPWPSLREVVAGAPPTPPRV